MNLDILSNHDDILNEFKLRRLPLSGFYGFPYFKTKIKTFVALPTVGSVKTLYLSNAWRNRVENITLYPVAPKVVKKKPNQSDVKIGTAVYEYLCRKEELKKDT